MATKNITKTDIALFAAIAVIVWGFVLFSVWATMTGPGSMQSRATGNMTLTAGDDGFSLEQDLNGLQNDPTLGEESQLISIE